MGSLLKLQVALREEGHGDFVYALSKMIDNHDERLVKLEDANKTKSNMPDNYFVIGHVEERLKKLEEKTKSVDDLLDGKVADIVVPPLRVEPHPISGRPIEVVLTHTQTDLNDAVEAETTRCIEIREADVDNTIEAERDRACRIVRGFDPLSAALVVSIKAKNILCDRIQNSE